MSSSSGTERSPSTPTSKPAAAAHARADGPHKSAPRPIAAQAFRHVLLARAKLGSKAVGAHGTGQPVALPRRLMAHPSAGEGASTLERTGRDPRRAEAQTDEHDDGAKHFDPLDPATRQSAQLGPPMASAPPATVQQAEEIAPRARVSMEELLPQLVKRIAWAGDRRRGTVQLELGAGRHAGTMVTVHADAGRVRVELQGAGDVEELRARIDARLKRHGLDVESVT